ncbi:MAG: radical SAM protein [Candidatus Firestonebacteria bacterium]|nr:radical SAM protein [Candidatus Firestonebacteria bacterium]
MYDRSIYKDNKYTNLVLIETARGCRFSCEFCSISSFFKQSYNPRPVEDVINELKAINKSKIVFFVDDNIAVDFERTYTLLAEVKKLNIKWISQVSMNVAKDENLVKLMKDSGCLGVLTGFESVDSNNIKQMAKGVNSDTVNYEKAVSVFKKYNLIIYGTFIFGYDYDTYETFKKTFHFIQKHKFFFSAFNHLVPFPGTPIYKRLEKEKRLLFDKWWLSDKYKFGDIAFKPKAISSEELSHLCFMYRKKMYSLLSILKRGLDFRCNCRTPLRFYAFFNSNLSSKSDVKLRQGLPLGIKEENEL